MKTQRTARIVRHHNELQLELAGIHVWLGYSDPDGIPMVVIDTPEDSDVWKRMLVYMNDGKAVVWE